MITSGAWSPPIASRATRTWLMSGGREVEGLDLTSAIRSAGRTEVVRPARAAALRAGLKCILLRLVVCPTLVASRLRCFSFRNGHCERGRSIPRAGGTPVTRAGLSLQVSLVGQFSAQFLELRPARIPRWRAAVTDALAQVTATAGAKTVAVLGAENLLWQRQNHSVTRPG